MFTREFLMKAIKKVVGAIDKGSNEEEKRIAHELTDDLFPQEEKFIGVFYQKDKITYYKYSNKKTYETTCNEKNYNKYIGCSITEGYARYGSKTKYNKHLKEFYGCSHENLETYSLIDAYTRFGGKEKFEKFVDSKFFPKPKTE